MKKLLSIILALLMMFSVCPLSAFTFLTSAESTNNATVQTGITGNCTWTLDGTKLTISGNGSMGDCYEETPWGTDVTGVVIESGVTKIGAYSFNGCYNIKEVILPKTVTEIGDYAFNGCDGLKNIELPDSIEIVRKNAFKSCNNLQYYCTDNAKYLGNENNKYLYLSEVIATEISSFEFPIGVKIIGDYAFYNYKNFTEISIPKTVTSIGCYAFYEVDKINITDVTAWCNIKFDYSWIYKNYYTWDLYVNGVMAKKLIIPEGVTTINSKAFDGCRCLEKVSIPESLIKVEGYNIFEDSEKLQYNTYENGKYLGNEKNKYLVLIDVSDEVKNFNFHDGVKVISVYAFSSCDNLTYLSIPKTVVSICSGAFSGCDNLQRVNITDLATWCNIQFSDCYSNPFKKIFINDVLVRELVIPDGVTSINPYTFYCFDYLTSVTIPKGVKNIGNYAFYGCENLSSVTIPNTINTIGDSAFDDCYSIDKVNITDISAWCNIDFATYSSNPISCGGDLYINDVIATTILIPTSVTTIKKYAFGSFSELETVYIPNSVTYIGEGNFNSYSTKIYVDNGSYAEKYAMINEMNFQVTSGITGDCKWKIDNLTTLTISGNGKMDNYENVYERPWGDRITEVVIEKGVTAIGKYAFSDCDSLSKVSIPSTVKTIGEYAFYGCSNIKDITLPEGVTSIGQYALASCDNLENILLPNSLEKIDDNVFLFSDKLNYNIHSGNKYLGNATNKRVALMKVTQKDITSFIVPNGVKIIAESAFIDCTNLKVVDIPSSVTDIDFYAFSSYRNITIISDEGMCADEYAQSKDNLMFQKRSGKTGNCTWTLNGTKLTISGKGKMGDYSSRYSDGNPPPWELFITEVVIEKGVTAIGKYAFSDCGSLSKVSIPSTVKTIGEYAFHHCRNIKDITLPEGVTSIGQSAFASCDNLKDIAIPSGVTTINAETFYFCSNLEKVTLPEKLESICIGAFVYCEKLESINIPENTKNVGDAFYGCNSLKFNIYKNGKYLGNKKNKYFVLVDVVSDRVSNFEFAKNVEIISDNTFQSCVNLKSVNIPNTVKSIGNDAFSHCISLNNVTLPNNLTKIGVRTFLYCKKLKKVIVPNKVTSIGKMAFDGCDNLTITIPKSVTNIDKTALIAQNTIYGYHGSYAEKFAKKIGSKFVPLNCSYKTTITKATTAKDGQIKKVCNVCKKITKTTINKIATAKLSTTNYSCNGKVKTPTVTVKDSKGKTLKNGTAYTVSYASGRKSVGKYAVKITFKGNYSGTKTVYFNINPKGTSLKSVSAGKKQITVKWNKQGTQTSGYQVQYSTSKSFKNAKTVIVSSNKTTSKTIKNLTGGKKYYVRVRTYKNVGKTKYYSAWSSSKYATVKKK